MEGRRAERKPLAGSIKVAPAGAADIAEGIAVLARGMRDNPLHVAAFGDDPDLRRRRIERIFDGLFSHLGGQRPICARLDGRIVGFTGDIRPGACRPSVAQRLRMLPALASLGPRSAGTTLRWIGEWAKHDPDRPHSHYGPFGVEPDLQGRGIGSRILAAYCERLDRAGEHAYLETDKPENVRLYARFGFEVIGEADVIGVPNWFMWRAARAAET